MNINAIVFAAALAISGWLAEQPTQRISPHETATYNVAGATISITYGRPSKRGRAIFGSLVPYDQIWMPGADEATIIHTDKPLEISRVVLPAGSYSLYTLPSQKTWKVIINRQTGQFHTVYNADQDLVRADGHTENLTQPIEQLTITAGPSGRGGELRIAWDTLAVTLPFSIRP